MNELLAAIAAKRERLDQLRPLSAKMLANLEHRYDIELKDRLEYIRSLQEEQAGGGPENFNAHLYKRLDATLEEYLSALQEALPL